MHALASCSSSRGRPINSLNQTTRGNGAGLSIGVTTEDMSQAMLLTNVTVAENFAAGSGGGIEVYAGIAKLTNLTIARNAAVVAAGGILNPGASTGSRDVVPTVQLRNTILAQNVTETPGASVDCVGTITSFGGNLIGDPHGCETVVTNDDRTGVPGLTSFLDDSNPGRSHYALLADSAAIDAGIDVCLPLDQLGQGRVGQCDIGAVEFQPPPAVSDRVTIRRADYQNRLSVVVLLAESSDARYATLTVTVPGCFTDAPMARFGRLHLMLRSARRCGNLDGRTATVISDGGGMSTSMLR